jgi:hypothetical protein
MTAGGYLNELSFPLELTSIYPQILARARA